MALRRKYAPLIALCREKIILAPPQTSGKGDANIFVTVKWPVKENHLGRFMPDLPKDFPTGTYVERNDSFAVIRHNVVAVLKWFKAKYYIDYDAKDLFAARLPVMMVNAKMELKFERMLDINKEFLYDDVIAEEQLDE
jgi:hypothetical protein